MRLAVATALALVVGFVPSAVAAEEDRLVFTDSTSVSQLAADGSGRESIRGITGQECEPAYYYTPRHYCPAHAQWSPDGARVAFAAWDRLYLWSFVTRQTELVPSSVAVASHFVAWSPDGTRVAFIGPRFGNAAPADLYVQRVDEPRTMTRLTTDGAVSGKPDWSADGAWITYPARVGNRVDIFVVAADGSSRRRLTDGSQDFYANSPVWSPSGERIAFARRDNIGPHELLVMNADGTGQRTVENAPHWPSSLRWTSDGKRLVLSAFSLEEGQFTGAAIWSVAVDGSGSTRITESRQNYDVTPDVSPGGNRIAFIRTYGPGESDGDRFGLYVANADGTCERRIAKGSPLGGVHWRPRAGAADEQTHCLALIVTPLRTRYAGWERTIHFALVNDGTEVIRDISVGIGTVAPSVRFAVRGAGLGCSVPPGPTNCRLAELAPGERRNIELDVNPLVLASKLRRVVVSVVAWGYPYRPEGSADRFEITLRPLDCARGLQADRALVITGTKEDDIICGRLGRDVINAGRGDDHVDADAGDDMVAGGDGNDLLFGGSGVDTLVGGRGRDRIFGRSGRDYVRARDGQRDYVSCGAGRDFVLADRSDTVLRDCERVSRRSP